MFFQNLHRFTALSRLKHKAFVINEFSTLCRPKYVARGCLGKTIFLKKIGFPKPFLKKTFGLSWMIFSTKKSYTKSKTLFERFLDNLSCNNFFYFEKSNKIIKIEFYRNPVHKRFCEMNSTK